MPHDACPAAVAREPPFSRAYSLPRVAAAAVAIGENAAGNARIRGLEPGLDDVAAAWWNLSRGVPSNVRRSGAARVFLNGLELKMSDGKLDDAKGKAKEAGGELSGDDSLKREGKADQAAGTVKEKTNKAVDKIKAALDRH